MRRDIKNVTVQSWPSVGLRSEMNDTSVTHEAQANLLQSAASL